MSLDTPADVAMILPIPVVQPAKEDAVQFIDLSEYDHFFRDLKAGFPRPKTRTKGAYDFAVPPPGALKLEVHSVGSFDASFVPTVKDFSRLDARFRLPEGTWDQLPQYAGYGFAVFKLKKGNQKLHPMAFSFPSVLAKTAELYFPTVHIHDGKVHAKERFDHTLYGQTWPKAGLSSREGWEESQQLAASFAKVEKSKGLLWDKGHVYRRHIRGLQKNEDILAQAIVVG
ncbi:MAG: hypothetical protein ACSHYF_10485 [Verrucomicrobiaceae bacterium]